MTVVTLLTDFGTADGYVGAMKGVIATLAADARLVDLTHDVPAQDVRAGAWALAQACPLFPAGTIHVAVVDPGVGGERDALLLRAGEQLYVGPDNGLLSWIPDGGDATAWCLDRPEWFAPTVSATFHGRDIFAHVAGHLARGVEPRLLGTPLAGWDRLPWPRPEVSADHIVGAVVHVDRFGNLITNVEASALERRPRADGWRVAIDGQPVGPLRRTYADVERGQWVAYLGSGGTVEVAVRDGDARARSELGVAACVELTAGGRR